MDSSHIKQGLKFHDGTDVTAKSFQYALNRICNPKTTTAPSGLVPILPWLYYDDVVNCRAIRRA